LAPRSSKISEASKSVIPLVVLIGIQTGIFVSWVDRLVPSTFICALFVQVPNHGTGNVVVVVLVEVVVVVVLVEVVVLVVVLVEVVVVVVVLVEVDVVVVVVVLVEVVVVVVVVVVGYPSAPSKMVKLSRLASTVGPVS